VLILLPALVTVLLAHFVYLLLVVVIVSQRAEHLSRCQIIPLSQNVFNRHADLVVIADDVPDGNPCAFNDRLPPANAVNFYNMGVGHFLNRSVLRAHRRSSFQLDYKPAPRQWQRVIRGTWNIREHIAPPGNSGLLGDPHYGDLLPLWLKGEYVPALWKREEVEKDGVERAELEG